MKCFLSRIAIFSLCYISLGGQAAATHTTQELTITPQGIYIQLHERTLGEVLSHIHQVSGIRFSFPTAMGITPITATIHAHNLPSVVRELLRPFNTTEVWDNTQLAQVYIFERSTAASVSEESANDWDNVGQRWKATETLEPPPASSLPPPPPPPMDIETPTFERK